MKKFLIFLLILGATTIAYSKHNDPVGDQTNAIEGDYDPLEDKIKVQLEKEVKIEDGKYDVDIYKVDTSDANEDIGADVKLEIPNTKIKKSLNYEVEGKKIFEILKGNGIKVKKFYVEADFEKAEDQTVYKLIEEK